MAVELTTTVEVTKHTSGTDSDQGFRDSFVDTPSRDSSPQKKPNRFSDDFSNTDSPIHTNHTNSNSSTGNINLDGAVGGIDVEVETENWEHFELEPDRSETPPNEIEHNGYDLESQSLPNLLDEPMKLKEVSEKKWESFDDDPVTNQHTAKQHKIDSNGDLEDVQRYGIDTETNQSEWTALNDTLNHNKFTSQPTDSESLPFRRTQSMRADTHRAVRIVDSLRQRRLSNTSLDRELQQRFSNEDELTRKFKLDRQWDIFLKLNKRIPGTKTKWLPVKVTVKDGVLSVKKGAIPPSGRGKKIEYAPSVVEDIILQLDHTVTGPVPRSYDRQTKLHQIKLQKTVARERRTFKRFLLREHITSSTTLLKLGSHDLGLIQNISEAINEAVRQLPVIRMKGVAYRSNEVFVDVKEYSDILMNCDGAVLDRKSLNRVYIQAFLTAAPECTIVLNDVEATLLQGKSLLSQSMTRQVRLRDTVLHPCVNADLYRTSRELKFQPIDGSTFELFRCSIDPYVSPPINVSCLMEYNQTQHNVRITSSFIVRKKHNLQQRPITNFTIKFPIPSSWSSLFLTESKFGQKRTIGSTAALRGSFRRKIKTNECQIETHLGSAKYEPEHQAIMWRLGSYSNTSQPHTFTCEIQLKSGMQKPDMQNEQAVVTYAVPGSSTGISVKGFHVEGEKPETWVKYEIQYKYRVQMFPDLSID